MCVCYFQSAHMVRADPTPTANIWIRTCFVCTNRWRVINTEMIGITRGPRAMRSGAVLSETAARPPFIWSDSARTPPAGTGRRGRSFAGSARRPRGAILIKRGPGGDRLWQGELGGGGLRGPPRKDSQIRKAPWKAAAVPQRSENSLSTALVRGTERI